jgi:outer membrane protein assembly factor BamB
VRDGSKNGLVTALRAKDGKKLWTKPLPSRTESSPLLVGGRLYFGSEDGTVYALDAKTAA